MPGLRERHMDRTRAAIVDAALALFAEQGFTETTVDAIAERADVGRRTFFRYFPAKESVLFHDIDAQIQAMLDSLGARPEDEPPFEALLWVLRDSAGRFSADVAATAGGFCLFGGTSRAADLDDTWLLSVGVEA